MDRKAIAVLIASFALLLLWGPIVNHWFPPTRIATTNQLNVATGSTYDGPASTNTSLPGVSQPDATTGARALPSTRTPASSSGREDRLVLTNSNARYTFTSHGGGLKSIELFAYEEKVPTGRKRDRTTGDFATLNADAPQPVLSIFGTGSPEDDQVFELKEIEGGVRAEKQLTNGLQIVKEFRLGSNYLVHAKVSLGNRSAQPLALPTQEWIAGTSTPMNPQDNALLAGVLWYDGAKKSHVETPWFDNHTFGCPMFGGTPREEYVTGASNVVWSAAHNQFFALAAMPSAKAESIAARRVALPAPTAAEIEADPATIRKPMGIQASLVYPPITLGPNQAIERDVILYAGPKQLRTLERIGMDQKNSLELIMGYDGFFGWFARLLLLSMNGLYSLGLGYGMAIITITVIIKLLFWPLTQASTRSMKRMAALQPQMKALQEKYKDDPTKMNKRLMEFMREHKVNPMGGCLPILLQIPVFIGFYQMIQAAIELRGAQFLWIYDLSKPDTLFYIPGFNLPFNPMPLIMGVTMFYQARLTPAAPGMDPLQQKIMKYMPLMFLFILYNFSAGLTLYWTVQNLLSILQMKLTRAQDEKRPTTTPVTPPRDVKMKKRA